MDIGTITNMVATRLTKTQTLVNQLIADAKDYIQAMQTASEMQFLPGTNVNTTADFRPAEQQSDDAPPIQSGNPANPVLPAEPPVLVLNDYVASDPIVIDQASAFSDIAMPTADTPKILYGEDITSVASAAIAKQFIAAIEYEIQNSNFDSGWLQQVQEGIASRSAIAVDISSRVASRLASMGLSSTAGDMLTLADYQKTDDVRAIANRQREARVENDRIIVETAVRLAEMLYQHANEVYGRALDVAKTAVEFGNAIYQLQIGIERTAIGISRTAMQTDFEVINAEESINKLNLKARIDNIKIFDDVSNLVIQSLENITSKYGAKVSKYGLSTDKARALADFEMSKGRLSEQALSERVSIAVQNLSTALAAFTTVAQNKRVATAVGEQVYSEAIRGAVESRTTLIRIGKQDTTTTQG